MLGKGHGGLCKALTRELRLDLMGQELRMHGFLFTFNALFEALLSSLPFFSFYPIIIIVMIIMYEYLRWINISTTQSCCKRMSSKNDIGKGHRVICK